MSDNSTEKLAIGFEPKPDGHRWVYVELVKYGPPYPRWIPAFRDLYRIIQAIAECEDEKYPPPANGRFQLIQFLRDCVRESDWPTLAARYKIPERRGGVVVNSNGAKLVELTADQIRFRFE